MWDQIEQSLRLSMERVITKIAMLLPGLLAFVLAVVIFAAIGWLVALLVQKMLGALRFDDRLRDQRQQQALPHGAPRELASQLA